MSTEIFSIIDEIAASKSIEPDVIIGHIQDSFAGVMSNTYEGYNLVCILDKNTGRVDTFYRLDIVDSEAFISDKLHILKQDLTKEELKTGKRYVLRKFDFLIPLTRIQMQAIRQNTLTRIKEEQKAVEFQALSERLGKVVECYVKKTEDSYVLLDIKGIGEGIMFKNGLFPGDHFESGNKILCCISRVEKNLNGCQAILERRCPKFVEGMLSMLVPEIKEGLVSVKDVVGLELCSYVIIVLWGVDPKSDPIRACMGTRGSNLFKLSDEMHIARNKIKLAIYDQNVSKFAMNLFKDSDVLSVKIDENNENRVRVVVPEDRVKDAIGVGGYKAKVASKALKRSIEVKGIEEEKKEQEVHSAHMVAKLTSELKVDNPIAQFLVSSGLESVKKIAQEDAYRICMKIPGFGIEIAKELISRAQEFIQTEEAELMAKIIELNVKQELYEIFEISLENCVKLGESGIKSILDISKTSSYQLMKICHSFTKVDADTLIKNAIGYLSYEGE